MYVYRKVSPINQESDFYEINIKHIQFNEAPATAIFLVNINHIFEIMRLENRILLQNSKEKSIESYTSTISHEFTTPLKTAILLLNIILTIVSHKRVHNLCVQI